MTTETCGYRMKIQHFSALQILSVKTRGYRHKCHPTLLSIELQLQLPTIVTNDLIDPILITTYLNLLLVHTLQ